MWKVIWKLKIPSKVVFFVWTACRERLPTLDFLQNRGMCIPNMCPMCLQDGESLNHLFIYCPFTREVWEDMLREVGAARVFLGDITNLFLSWQLFMASVKAKVLWSLMCLVVCWSIWLERSRRTFEIMLNRLMLRIEKQMIFLFLGWEL